MAATMHPRQAVLGDDEVVAYRRDGFLVPRFRFRGEQLARLQALAQKLLADNPGRGDEPHDTRSLFLVRGIDRCGCNDFRRGHPALH